jgi:hypothetical protein
MSNIVIKPEVLVDVLKDHEKRFMHDCIVAVGIATLEKGEREIMLETIGTVALLMAQQVGVDIDAALQEAAEEWPAIRAGKDKAKP